MYLSFGERPVKIPVLTLTAPSSVTTPLSKPDKKQRRQIREFKERM